MDTRETLPTRIQGDLAAEAARGRTPSNRHRRFRMPSSARPRSTLTPSPRQTHRRLGPSQVHSNHGTRERFLQRRVHPNVQSRPETAGPATYYPPHRGEPPMNLPAHAAPATYWHPPEIPSQLPVSADPLMEQTSRREITYYRTPSMSMDGFTGQSNWNRQEVAPPGQPPFRNEGFSQPPSTFVLPTQPLRFVTHEGARSIVTPSQYRAPSNEALFATETTCPFLNCHRTYNRRQDLERHILKHLARSLYCSQLGCNWTGRRRDGLRDHLKQKHGGIPVPDQDNSSIYDAKALVKQILNEEITPEKAVHDAHLSFLSGAELLGKLNVWRES